MSLTEIGAKYGFIMRSSLCSARLIAIFSQSEESCYTKFCVSFVKLASVKETANIFLAGWGNAACVCSDNTLRPAGSAHQ